MEKCTKGYFEFDTRQDGLYLTVYPPQQGEPALDAGEVLYYIEKKNIYGCDIALIGDTVKKGATQEVTVKVSDETPYPVSEFGDYRISHDTMTLEAVFYPPFKGAEELTYEEIQKDLKNIGVISGISEEAIRLFLLEKRYFEIYVLAKGTKSAKKEITNDKGQKEVINVTINTYTYTFTTIPTNAEELKQYDITTADGRYKTMALLILAYRTWTPTNPTDCEEMISYLNNKEMTQYYKNFLRDRMKADNGYKYLGNSYLNGATPANNYTPSKPISITLRQDTLPGKGNSISEDIPYFEPTQTTPAIYRSFTDFAGSDSSRWICTYKHSKTGKWYIWDQSWHDLLTRIKQPAGNYEY